MTTQASVFFLSSGMVESVGMREQTHGDFLVQGLVRVRGEKVVIRSRYGFVYCRVTEQSDSIMDVDHMTILTRLGLVATRWAACRRSWLAIQYVTRCSVFS